MLYGEYADGAKHILRGTVRVISDRLTHTVTLCGSICSTERGTVIFTEQESDTRADAGPVH